MGARLIDTFRANPTSQPQVIFLAIYSLLLWIDSRQLTGRVRRASITASKRSSSRVVNPPWYIRPTRAVLSLPLIWLSRSLSPDIRCLHVMDGILKDSHGHRATAKSSLNKKAWERCLFFADCWVRVFAAGRLNRHLQLALARIEEWMGRLTGKKGETHSLSFWDSSTSTHVLHQ